MKLDNYDKLICVVLIYRWISASWSKMKPSMRNYQSVSGSFNNIFRMIPYYSSWWLQKVYLFGESLLCARVVFLPSMCMCKSGVFVPNKLGLWGIFIISGSKVISLFVYGPIERKLCEYEFTI